MDNFLIYEEIQKRDSCIVYRGRIKRSIDFVMIYCVDKFKRHELSNLVRLMYELDHPNIMKFREWYETTNHLWLVMDLCDGGSLKSIIQADGSLPEASIRTIGVHICQENFFYTAPEVLRGGEYSVSSDLWSLGCILYEMFAGRQLYDERNTNKLTQKILNDRFVLPMARGSAKPSIEFSSLLQGLLIKEPAKRLNWPGILTHPFWSGQLTHLVRPQTGVTKKSISHGDTTDRPPISSRIATTDRPESNVSFSLSCTKTSIQIAQQNKPDETDGNKTPRNDYSSINTHEQSTSVGSESIERLRKMLFSKAELQPTAIIENKTIQKTLPFKFENKLLPFQLGKCKNKQFHSIEIIPLIAIVYFEFGSPQDENLSRLSSVDLQEHASTIKKELSNTTAGSPTSANGMRIKPNLLNYIGFTCLEQANSGPFADALIAKEIHKDFLYLITNGGTMEL
ncbi:unnamed protein product [Rotaria magnacalcarata]|uniref:Protein kinase domain-containing protein n=1 Tax=Rotaria magnacalcarata TaxID=392030 RepID=A0A8S2JVD5_9BILA|nr:unnamed protein product [Rotaria magnacalcarata]